MTKVYFSYSDVAHEYVMHKACQVQAAGATFVLLGPNDTMVKSAQAASSPSAPSAPAAARARPRARSPRSSRPQGPHAWPPSAIPCPTATWPSRRSSASPSYADLDKHQCTIEEREEYEPHIEAGIIVYAGVDYEAILREAEKEADVILWDGGNNDFPFYKSDLEIVVVDPHRGRATRCSTTPARRTSAGPR